MIAEGQIFLFKNQLVFTISTTALLFNVMPAGIQNPSYI